MTRKKDEITKMYFVTCVVVYKILCESFVQNVDHLFTYAHRIIDVNREA